MYWLLLVVARWLDLSQYRMVLDAESWTGKLTTSVRDSLRWSGDDAGFGREVRFHAPRRHRVGISPPLVRRSTYQSDWNRLPQELMAGRSSLTAGQVPWPAADRPCGGTSWLAPNLINPREVIPQIPPLKLVAALALRRRSGAGPK